MVSLEKGQYYAVAKAAKDIWQIIKRPTVVRALVDELLAKYEVERAVCERETLGFLKALAAENLIQVQNEAIG